MRFKLKLSVNQDNGNALPINYMYELSSAIYHILSLADDDYATWLHSNGYQDEKKKFKLFTFSRLFIPDFSLDTKNGRLLINSSSVDWFLAFLPENGTKAFIKGIFIDQKFTIGDKISKVSFTVSEIDLLPSINDNEKEMDFDTLSPICISLKMEDGKVKYLSPLDESFSKGLLQGLLSKYKAYSGKDFPGETYCDIHLLSEPKSHLITIKSFTPQETKVKGYSFRFSIRVPFELLTIAYEGGIGEKCSLGFGMLKQF